MGVTGRDHGGVTHVTLTRYLDKEVLRRDNLPATIASFLSAVDKCPPKGGE